MANYYYMGGEFNARLGRWNPTLFEINADRVNFDDNTGYLWGSDPVSDDILDDPVVVKFTYSESDAVVSIDASYNFTNEGKTFPAGSNRRHLQISKNGNVVMLGYLNSTKTGYIFTLTKNLEFIDSTTFGYGANIGFRAIPRLDNENNIYVIIPEENFQSRVRKYDSDLNILWTSGLLGDSDTTSFSSRSVSVQPLNNDKTAVYVRGDSQGTMYILDDTDGSISTSLGGASDGGLEEARLSPYLNQRIVLVTASGVEVYEDDLTLVQSTDLADVGFSNSAWGGALYMQSWKDGTILQAHPASSSFFARYHPLDLTITFEVSEEVESLSFDNSDRIIANGGSNFKLINLSDGTVIYVESPITGISGTVSNIQQVQARYDSWQLDLDSDSSGVVYRQSQQQATQEVSGKLSTTQTFNGDRRQNWFY